MGSQVEIPVPRLSNTAVYHRAGADISGPASVALCRGIEPSVMPLHGYNNGDLWQGVRRISFVLTASRANSGQLHLQHLLELALRDPVSVNDDVLWERSILLSPKIQSRSERFLELVVLAYLLAAVVNPCRSRPLVDIFVNACNKADNAGRKPP